MTKKAKAPNELTIKAAALLDEIIALAEKMPADTRLGRARLLAALSMAYIEALQRRPEIAAAEPMVKALEMYASLRRQEPVR